MKIYLASRYGRRAELAGYAKELEAIGHTVTSRWLLGVHEAADDDKSRWGEFAQNDVDDVYRADLLIAFTESEPFPRGSRHVEFGAALAWELGLIVIGPVENVFHAMPQVGVYATWAQFIAQLPEHFG